MQRPETDLEEVYEAIPPPCSSHESTCRVVRRIDFLRYANPQCNASLRRLREGKLFQFEARQIFTLPEAPFLKGHQVAHYWLCRKCVTFMTLGLKDGAVEIKPLRR
jgi:hypothetical protein